MELASTDLETFLVLDGDEEIAGETTAALRDHDVEICVAVILDAGVDGREATCERRFRSAQSNHDTGTHDLADRQRPSIPNPTAAGSGLRRFEVDRVRVEARARREREPLTDGSSRGDRQPDVLAGRSELPAGRSHVEAQRAERQRVVDVEILERDVEHVEVARDEGLRAAVVTLVDDGAQLDRIHLDGSSRALVPIRVDSDNGVLDAR